MNYKGHFAFFALFLLLSVAAIVTNAQVSAPATVNFQVSGDGERVEMDGVNIGEKESTYVSSNLMIYKALGAGYAGSTASVPNQYTSTGATIQYDAGNGQKFYYVSQVNRQSLGDPFFDKPPNPVSWEKPLLPNKDWSQVSTEGDTAIVQQGQDFHVIANGNLQFPGTFMVYSAMNDQSTVYATISNAQTDCSSPNQRCSATVATSSLPSGYYYVTYSSGGSISNPMYVKVGTPPTDSSSSFVLKDAKTGETKTYPVTTTRANKDVAAGIITGTDLKFYVWKNGNAPGISQGETKTNAVYTLSSLGLTFTVDSDWKTYTKLIFSNGKVIDLKLVDGKIKVDTATPGDWSSGISATVNSDGSLVLTQGSTATTTPQATTQYDYKIFAYDEKTSKLLSEAKVTFGKLTTAGGVTDTKTVTANITDGIVNLTLEKGVSYSVFVEAAGYAGTRFTVNESGGDVRKSVTLLPLKVDKNTSIEDLSRMLTIENDTALPLVPDGPCKGGKEKECTVTFNKTVKLSVYIFQNGDVSGNEKSRNIDLPDGRTIRLNDVGRNFASVKPHAELGIRRGPGGLSTYKEIEEGKTETLLDGLEITIVSIVDKYADALKTVEIQIVLKKCACPEEKAPPFISVLNTGTASELITVSFFDKWEMKSFKGEPENIRTTCKKAPYGFVYLKEQGRYVSLDEATKILGKNGLSKYLGKNPFWIYGREKCELNYEVKEFNMYKDINLQPGNNFVSFTKDMSGKSISEIGGNCDSKFIYKWNNEGQAWVTFSDRTTMTEDDITSGGLLIKSEKPCTFGETKLTVIEKNVDQQIPPVLMKWESVKWSDVPKKETDDITCTKDGESFFKDTVNGCRAQGGAVQECIPPVEMPLTTKPPRAMQNYSPSINLRVNWEWLNNLTRDVNRTGVANNTYNATSFDCDDFADGLEKKLTAMGYDATFTYMNCWDGINASSLWAHAITDVHAPNGDVVFIEPQNERITPMDKDGDGVVEVRRNEPQDGKYHETDNHCMIDVYDSKEVAEANGVVMD